MLVCGDCGRELKCVKNGKGVYWGETMYLPGDEFECPQCHKFVIKTTDVECFEPDRTRLGVRGREFFDPRWTPEEIAETVKNRC